MAPRQARRSTPGPPASFPPYPLCPPADLCGPSEAPYHRGQTQPRLSVSSCYPPPTRTSPGLTSALAASPHPPQLSLTMATLLVAPQTSAATLSFSPPAFTRPVITCLPARGTGQCALADAVPCLSFSVWLHLLPGVSPAPSPRCSARPALQAQPPSRLSVCLPRVPNQPCLSPHVSLYFCSLLHNQRPKPRACPAYVVQAAPKPHSARMTDNWSRCLALPCHPICSGPSLQLSGRSAPFPAWHTRPFMVQNGGQQTFSGKGQKSPFSFAGHMFSVTTTQRCCWGEKTAIDDT